MSATSRHIEELEKQLDCENERIIQLLDDKFALQAENKKLREFVEFCAESRDASRHDGLREPYPANSDYEMWGRAMELLGELA